MTMVNIDLLLANGATYKKISRGNYIFHEGDTCHYYYQLVEGRVRWLNSSDTGKQLIQSIVEPGQCFGELPLFDDQPYAACAIAEVNSVIIRLSKETFIQLVKNNNGLLFDFTRLLAQRIRFKFLLLKEFACYNPEHQVMALLNHLKANDENNHNSHFAVSFTRQQIADMLGLRVETVIRTIKKLQQSGRLTIDNRKVVLDSD